MSINRHPARLAFTTQIVCIAWLSLACPAYPAGKSPDDCKLENCQEWDEYLHDCVPIDPGPKPEGCYKLNDQCKWEPYTPDCKLEEDQVSKMQLIIFSLWARLKALQQPTEDAATCCACNNGDWGACAAAATRNITPCPGNACDEEKRLRALISSLQHMLNISLRDLEDAKKLLEDCRNCRK